MTTQRDKATDSTKLVALRQRGAAIPDTDVLLAVIEARIEIDSLSGPALHSPLLGKITDSAYLYLTTQCLVLSGPWGTLGYRLDQVSIGSVHDQYRCQLDLAGDVVQIRAVSSITDFSSYIAAVQAGDADSAARLRESLLACKSQPVPVPTGWASAVKRGYVGIGVGTAGVLGAIPTNNAAGYVLGSLAIALGSLAWLKDRHVI